MKKFLIIYAHPNPESFCSAISKVTINTLKNLNHEVLISDLYAQKFNPVASPSDFIKLGNKDNFNFINEQKLSFENNFLNYSSEIKDELDKIKWADNLIFIFPLWWGSYPAILKGWIDKCFVYGHSWTQVNTFKNGLLKGKKGMAVVTCDDTEKNFSPSGLQGMTVENMLHHFNNSTLRFVGMDVIHTHAIHQLYKLDENERKNELEIYKNKIMNFNNLELLFKM